MRAPYHFDLEAQKYFAKARLPGTYCGIHVEETDEIQKCFIIHFHDGAVQKTLWPEANYEWPLILRDLNEISPWGEIMSLLAQCHINGLIGGHLPRGPRR
jgi:hypothetical protein